MAWVVGRGECPDVAADIEFEGRKVAYYDKHKSYAEVEAWYAKYKDWFEREYPGKHLTINVLDVMEHVIAADYDAAHKAFWDSKEQKGKYGPTPPHGRLLFDVRLRSPAEIAAAHKRREAKTKTPA